MTIESSSTADLAINLLAALIWAIIGGLAYRFVYVPVRSRRTALSRALPYRHGSKIAICYGILPPRPGLVYYTVEEGDLAAINYADSTLTALYGRNRIATVNFYSAEVRLGELPGVLSVSGPKWNRVTELMIGRLGSPIMFNQTDELVVERNGEKTEYRAVRRSNGDEQTCYGFVIAGAADSPSGKNQDVVVCAGLNTLSTYGSVVFLMSLAERYSFRHYPSLARALSGKKWGVVLRVENISNPNKSGAPRNPLDPDHIHIEIVDVLREQDFTDPYVYRF